MNNKYLSAQMPTVNEQFSILHPVTTVPSVHNTAAPTLNLLYGQYAYSLASVASLIRF